MTLQELTTFVCNKIGKTDTESQSMCKDFVRNRYKMIWDSFTWNDSKILVTQSVPASTLEVAINAQVELVISVSWNNQYLSNLSQETVMMFNPELLDQLGTPLAYVSMPKVGGQCVIRFVQKPNEAKDIVVLGKKVFTQLALDADSPILRGIDYTLLAMVEGDMLERQRQYGKAQSKFSEGAGQLQQMIDLEANQQTKVIQIVPDIYDVVTDGEGSGYYAVRIP